MIKIPKISIVTPSYNQGEFLEECIDSILSQNYPNLEYIVMDGGSTDNSVEIIRRYEKYLTYWQSQPDDGQYAAINEGFKKTSGEIMAWLNSDDKYHHHALFNVAYIFARNENIEWITGRHCIWNKHGDVDDVRNDLPTYSREKYLKKQYDNPFIQQEGTFWHRSLWEKAGGTLRSDLGYAGDLELWTRFFRDAQLYVVDTLLGGYRIHGNQKATLFRNKYIEEADKVLDEEIALVNERNYKEASLIPSPIVISHNEIKSYIDAAYESSEHDIYKISDSSDQVAAFLFNKLIETDQAHEAEVKRMTASFEAMTRSFETSLSWKITAPLRWIYRKLEGLK